MNDVSDKNVQENYFRDYRAMIENAAWNASRIFKMDIEDIRSQSYLIFCEAVASFDPNKASFSTHLYTRLRTINDYCVSQQRRNNTPEFPTMEAGIWWDHWYAFTDALERLESRLELSADAQEILAFILGREWENPNAESKRLPRFSMVKSIYRKRNWMPLRTKRAWDEIKTWWESGAHYLEA